VALQACARALLARATQALAVMECDRRKRRSAGPKGFTIRPDIAASSLQHPCAEARPPRRRSARGKQPIPAHSERAL